MLVKKGGPTLVALSLLSELGKVDGVFAGVNHLQGEKTRENGQ